MGRRADVMKRMSTLKIAEPLTVERSRPSPLMRTRHGTFRDYAVKKRFRPSRPERPKRRPWRMGQEGSRSASRSSAKWNRVVYLHF